MIVNCEEENAMLGGKEGQDVTAVANYTQMNTSQAICQERIKQVR